MTKIVQTIHNAVALAADAGTDINVVEVDFSNLQGREFMLSFKTVGNATAPGSARTITPQLYWSDERISEPQTNVPTLLANRTAALNALALVDAASTTRYYEGSNGIFRPKAQYLYVALDKTTEDTGAITTLTTWLVRVAPEHPNNLP